MYNILWIDDQYEDLRDLIGTFSDEDIKLFPYKSLNAGITELKINCHKYDGVLLDGMFFENEDDINGTEQTKNLYKAVEEIRSLEKKFEIFIFTGQPNLKANEEFIVMFPNTYYKGNPITELAAKLKESADKQDDRQIINEYKNVFKQLLPNLLGNKHFNNLLQLLKNKKSEKEDFLKFRKIIESIFHRLAELKLIPNAIINDKGWLNGSSKFLAGKHTDYRWKTTSPIEPLILELLQKILFITQDASHNEGELKLKVDNYLQNKGNARYLTLSCMYGTLELIEYFGNFIEQNKDLSKNESMWYQNSDIWVNAIYEYEKNKWYNFVTEHGHKCAIPEFVLKKKNITLDQIVNGKILITTTYDEIRNKYNIEKIKIN